MDKNEMIKIIQELETKLYKEFKEEEQLFKDCGTKGQGIIDRSCSKWTVVYKLMKKLNIEVL